jgi:hypothetical protein
MDVIAYDSLKCANRVRALGARSGSNWAIRSGMALQSHAFPYRLHWRPRKPLRNGQRTYHFKA